MVTDDEEVGGITVGLACMSILGETETCLKIQGLGHKLMVEWLSSTWEDLVLIPSTERNHQRDKDAEAKVASLSLKQNRRK